MRLRPVRLRRIANIAPLAAILSIPMLAMLAFSVDMSYVVLVRTELQNAADAGALAAAQSLTAGYVAWNQSTNPASTYTAAATTAAQNVIQANSAGGTALVFNSGTDIEYGTTNPTTKAYSAGYTNYPNTVKVWARRDSTGGSRLKLFFAPVIGTTYADVTAVAGATLQTGTVAPLPSNISGLTGSDAVGVLPLVYNVNWWNNFVQTGKNPDGSAASADGNGTKYLTAFGGGGSSNALGQANWGWLSLDDSHNGSSDLKNWVDNGLSDSDFAALKSANLFPLSLHDSTTAPLSSSGPSGSYNWLGDNGAKTDVAHEINDYVGKTFLIPLYQPVTPTTVAGLPLPLPLGVSAGDAGIGKSNQFYYNIVGFAPVKIVDGGDNNSVSIAVGTTFPPETQITNQQVADTSGAQGSTGNPSTLVTAKLTQ